MKKVYLYFREFELGFLCQENGKYIWSPNPSEIKKFSEKYFFGDFLFLDREKPVTYDKIPHHFIEYVQSSSREDLKKSAKIEKGDSDFEKLYKMATLDYYNQDFVVKVLD